MSKREPQPTPAGRWVSYRPEIKVLDCTIRDGGLMNDHRFADETVRGGLRCLRRRWRRLHGDRLHQLPRAVSPGRVRALETLPGGGRPPHRGRQRHAAEAVRHGRRREERLPGGHPAQVGERAGHDPRRHLHPPDSPGPGHDQGRPRQGLRDVAQPDGPVHGARARAERGAAPGRPVRGGGDLHRRQLRRALRRADRRLHGQVPRLRHGGRQGGGDARPQQPATGLRQHHPGHHPRGQPARRQHGGAGARRRQLSHGAAAELPAQPQVPPAPGAALRPARHRTAARGPEVGLTTTPT